MNEEEKKKYHDKYLLAKQKGVKFYPDIIYKDLLVSFAIFLILIWLATFLGVPQEPKADPNDTSYIPRPEWYFLFLFEFLKFIPGSLEWVGTVVIPGAAILLLFLLPFIDRKSARHWSKRKVEIGIMAAVVLAMILLTVRAVLTTPKQEETAMAATISERVALGQDLYSVYCVECHGAEGEVTEIQGVAGLEGKLINPINSRDIMYTRTDETLFNIIDQGQQDFGMQPFGLGYGGELKRNEIEAIVAFMRYTWDDRAELPAEAVAAGAIPTLAPGQVASYEVHIAPIIKRYCLSCHRPGKENNNYLMSTYQEVMESGDHAPNIIPGDPNCNTLLMLARQEIEAGGPMPPTKPLKPELIALFENWIMNGALETAAEAAALTPAATITLPPPITPTP